MVDYIEKINDISIGGKQFSGARTDQQIGLVSSAFTMAAGATKTISLADYLPNDGYDYYVTIEGYCYTGTTSGNTADMQIRSGSSSASSANFYRRLCRSVTRHSSNQQNGSSIEIPISRSDRAFTIYNGDGSGTSGSMMVRLTSYRRMGKNDSLANKVEKITTSDGNYTFGGDVVDSNYKKIQATLWSGVSIASSGNKPFDLSSLIPQDGYEYEGMFSVTTGSASTTNKQINLFIGSQRMVTYMTRSASNYIGGGNAWIKIPLNRSITVNNSGSIATNSTALRLSYIRRIGTNSDSTTHHSYECIPSNTLEPNVLIYGSPTISDGVVSGFSASNYTEIPYSRVDGEYVVKFTMPSTTLSTVQSILHSEYFINLCVAENNYDVYMYNRQANSRVALFTANAGTTYWVKNNINSTSKTISYSTDGVLCKNIISSNDSFAGATYDGTRYIYVTDKGKINTSTDGVTWTGETTSNLPNINNNKLVYIGSYYFVGNEESIYRSSDLSNWSSYMTLSNNNNILDMTSEGTYIIVLLEGTTYYPVYVINPTNGVIVYSSSLQRVSGEGNYKYIQYGNNTYVVLTDRGYVTISTDGTNWSTPTQIANYNSWQSLAFDGEKFYAFPDTLHKEECYTSTDGLTWTLEYVYTPFRVQNCVFTNGMFLFGESDIYKGIVATGGQDYLELDTFTDNTMDSTLQYPILLGMSSSMAPTQYFLGSIDLNGCYIKVNGEKVWDGMTNSKILPIGGDGFDSEWVSKYQNIFTGETIGGNATKSYTLTNYLPDNDNVYEVLYAGYARTGNTSGNGANVWIRSNFQESAQCIISYINTRTSSNYADGKSGVILCKQDSSGKMTIYINNTVSATTGNCGAQLCGYRRIGTNGGEI